MTIPADLRAEIEDDIRDGFTILPRDARIVLDAMDKANARVRELGHPPKDDELAQAYQQGYQDGRRGLVAALREAISDREAKHGPTDVKARKWREVVGPSEGEVAQRAALAKVAQEQEGKA